MRAICLTAAFLLILGTAIAPATAQLKSYSAGTASTAEFLDAKLLENPLPKIPSHLHEECFKSCCIARFKIDEKGQHKVRLVVSSGSPEIDEITLMTLRQWKFKPAMLDGKPVPTTRRVQVEFEVD